MPWVKNERDKDSDVPMGCFNDAGVCEILGSYILNLLHNITQFITQHYTISYAVFLIKTLQFYKAMMAWQ